MNFNWQNIPRPLLVVIVLVLGVLLIPLLQEPHTLCDSQLKIFKENMKGYLYPQKIKSATRMPLYPRFLENCKLGNSAGGCYEYLNLLRRLVAELANWPSDCGDKLSGEKEVSHALREGVELMALIAWGEAPPEQGSQTYGFLESSDLALFCSLQSQWLRLWGRESWEGFRRSLNSKYPGEERKIVQTDDGKGKRICLNCDNLPTADQKFSEAEILTRSLFSLRCEHYR